MNRARLTLPALLFLVAGPVHAQTNVSGDWNVTIQSAQGANDVQVTFKQEGEKLSGIFKSQMGELPFDGGTVTGSDLKFGFSIPIQGQSLDVTMTGKLDGGAITGKAVFGSFGEGDWTGRRAAVSTAVPAAPAAPAAAAAAPSVAGGFSGKWDLTIKTQMGDVPVSASITEAAGRVSGTISGPQGDVDVSGTTEGKALKLAFVAKTPQGDIPISMTGDLDGDSIVNGKADFGGMGQGEWSGKRSKQ
jgi:hypothetical protein